MGFFNEFPHTRTYDNDLGWIIKIVKDLEENLQNFIKLNTVKYADPIQWNISTQYEANTVVIDDLTGVAYISTQPVPSGVNINNTDYWTPVFTLDLVNLNKNITLRDDGDNHNATFTSVVGDWVIVGGQLYRVIQDIGLHTAYVVGFNIEIYTVELFVRDYLNQVLTIIGDLQDLNTADKTSVVNAINSIVNIIGELQDLDTADKTSVVNAINSVVNAIGDLQDLDTADKTSVVNAINSIVNVIGDLQNLNTADKTSVVNAINSALSVLNTTIGDLQDLNTEDKSSIVNAINELISEPTEQVIVTPEMYGAVGDGVTDDTAAIQAALNAYDNVLFLNKTYMVDPGISIKPNSGNRLILSPNTVLKALPSNLDYYKVIYLTNVNHVEISGGTIVGDRDSHLTTTGESGHCINVRDCTDIYIHDLRCTKAWGDGIFIGGDDVLPERILVENCTIDNTRRNGLSIIRCDGVTIDNCNIHDISGTAPMDNIDIEPNFGTDAVNNLQIKNCKFDGMVECNLRSSTSVNTVDIINCSGGSYVAATGANTVNTLIQFIGCEADCYSGSFNMQNASPTSNVYVINCSSVARQVANDPSRSGVYFAGANYNVHINALKLYGSKFYRYVQSSTVTPTSFNNCIVDIISEGAETVYTLASPPSGLTITINNTTPSTSSSGSSIYIFEGRKYIQTGGSFFKFGGSVRCNGRLIVCNKTGASITISPDSDFAGTFCKSDGSIISGGVGVANNAVFIAELIHETNTVVSL